MEPSDHRADVRGVRTPLPRALVLLALVPVAMVVVALAGGDRRAGEWLSCTAALGAGWLLLRLARRRPGVAPLARPLGVGAIAYGLGWVVWGAVRLLDETPPAPSIADPLWLAFYPCAILTLVRAVRAAPQRSAQTVALDVAAAALAVGAFGTEFFAAPLVAGVDGTTLALIVSAAYPALDVLLAAMLVAAAVVLGWTPQALLVGAGLAAFLLGDYVYVTSVAEQAQGVPWGASTPVAFGMVLLAAAVHVAADGSRRPRRSASGAVTPAVFAAAALVLLLLDHAGGITGVTAVLAPAAIAAALIRLTASVRLERALQDTRRLANTDELTGLANRRALTRAVEARLAAGGDVALVLLDLDGFKEVNDSLGHMAGDELLALAGQRLRAALGEDEVLARLGGDEFAAAVAVDAAPQRAAAMLEALSEPFDVVAVAVAVHVGASAGVASSPQHGTTAFELLRRADEALYRAKAARGTVAQAAEDDGHRARRRIELLGGLGAALLTGEVRPYFQPQLAATDGRLVGAEALARWVHPDHGLVPPDLFLPGRAQAGLARALTQCILRSAAEHAAAWHAEGHDVPVAVNLSAADLADDALVEVVLEACRRHGLPTSALRLEVTESVVMADPDAALARLAQLRDAGIGLALDDFGTDHSSLAYLDVMPVDELKIDRGFIARLERPRTAQIVASTVALARDLGLRVVAEGVETAAQRDVLAGMGVDALQGWLFSPAVPGHELLQAGVGRAEGAGRPAR